MGADQKRKEAREHKFGAQSSPANSESQPAITTPIPDEDAKEQQAPRTKHEKGSDPLEKPTETHAADKEDIDNTSTKAVYQHDMRTESIQDFPEPKGQRFIVFIGNLPFSATDASIAKHFAKVHPKSIRHRTDKTTGKSKGFAFLEFEAYDRMKTCLKLYHHSNFDDGESPVRRLNVELTVGGGGGRSKDRKAKLREKNVSLNEERQRRAAQEEKQTRAEGKKKQTRRAKGRDSEAKGDEAAEPARSTDLDGDIHPSRRSRLLQS